MFLSWQRRPHSLRHRLEMLANLYSFQWGQQWSYRCRRRFDYRQNSEKKKNNKNVRNHNLGKGWTGQRTNCKAANAFIAFCDALLLMVTPSCSLTGIIFITLPTAFVRPSRNTNLCPIFKYSGYLMKRKCTTARSPVRRLREDIFNMKAVCRILPQCTTNAKKNAR